MAKSVFSVSLTSQIAQKFDLEENKSALIQQLLSKHYVLNDSSEVIEQELKEKMAILDEKKSLKEKEAQKLREEEEKRDKKVKDKLNYLKKIFKEDLGREITEKELNDYLELESNNLTSFNEYVEELKNAK